MTEWKLGKPEVCGVYWARSKRFKCHWLVEVLTSDAYFLRPDTEPLDPISYQDLEFGPIALVKATDEP